MDAAEYRGKHSTSKREGALYVGGVDLEKVSNLSWTGVDTRAGDLISIDCKNCGDSTGSSSVNGHPTAITVLLYCECVMNIRDNGIDIID